ncbi:MAG: major capsid protein [Planctomycetaceae bacterium]|nr:hypothetical protein [Planctomycetaceae bacterium]
MAELLIQYAAMTPNAVARGVVETFVATNPLFNVLRFQDTAEAISYEYNREASLGGVGFRALNADYTAAEKTSGINNPVIERLAIMGGEVNIDRQLSGNTRVKADRIAKKTKAAARFYVKNFIKGSTATRPTGFDGLYRRIAGDNLVYAGTHGGTIDLEVLDGLIARVPGDNTRKVLLMGSAMQIRLGSVLRTRGATVISMAEWQGQNIVTRYGGAQIIVPGDDELGAEIMAFNETRGNSSVSGSIIVFVPGVNDEEDVVGLARNANNFLEVADRGMSGTQDITVVEGRAGMAAHHPRCAVRYAGILNSNPA